MMPYIIILKVRKFRQSTRNRFGTAGKKPVGGRGDNVPSSLIRVNFHVPFKTSFGLAVSFKIKMEMYKLLLVLTLFRSFS